MKSSSGNLVHEVPPTDPIKAGVIYRPAEAVFQKGLTAHRNGETAAARALFEAAIDLQRKSGSFQIQARYLSFYGVSLMETSSKRGEALELCRRAVREEFFNPDLFYNLSRVSLRAGHKAEAYRAAMTGLALDSKHPLLRRHVAEMGIRRRPALRFLSRSHFLNRALGKMLRPETQRRHGG